MGSCTTKEEIVPHQDKRNKSPSPLAIASSLPVYNMHSTKLLNLREKLMNTVHHLDHLHEKADTEAKTLIRKHKGNPTMFTLKKMSVFASLSQEAKNQIAVLENALLRKNISKNEVLKIQTDTEILLIRIDEIIKLETCLKEGEEAKLREDKFRFIFKQREIHDEHIFPTFAKYEAEALEITLTTSSTFTRSQTSSRESIE